MNVEEVLDKHNVEYVSRGRDFLVHCLNPEHDDSNPSMRIDKLKGVFGCYSCGFSGNIYSYFNETNNNQLSIKTITLKEKIEELMWSKPLNYPLDTKWFEEDFRGISAETYRHFNAFTTSYIDDLDGRLVIPITDITRKITSFNGRYMYSELTPKYKFYPSGTKLSPFPPIAEYIDSSIILVEGIFDMLNLYDKGLKNAVCVFGTAFGNVKKKAKQKENIDKLLTYKYQGVNKVYILFDGDEAGRHSAESLKEYISNNFIVEIINLDDGYDPGSLTQKQVNALRKKLYE